MLKNADLINPFSLSVLVSAPRTANLPAKTLAAVGRCLRVLCIRCLNGLALVLCQRTRSRVRQVDELRALSALSALSDTCTRLHALHALRAPCARWVFRCPISFMKNISPCWIPITLQGSESSQILLICWPNWSRQPRSRGGPAPDPPHSPHLTHPLALAPI